MMGRRLTQLLEDKPETFVQKVLELRERFDCLMELPTERIAELQRKAVYANYIQGEGRRIDRMTSTFHWIRQ